MDAKQAGRSKDTFDQLSKSGVNLSDRKAKVLVKLIEAKNDETLVEKITRSTNNQNAIKDRDLHANDQEQAHIAAEFAKQNNKIFYEYKAGDWERVKRKK